MPIQFNNYSMQVMAKIEQASIAFLHEAAHEVTSQVKRNTAVGKVAGGDTKNSWKNNVDNSALKAVIGSPLENAIWEELGTGEYAANGNGRQGGWYVLIGNGTGQMPQQVVDAYGFPVKYGKDGKRFAYVTGKKPKRPLEKAYTKLKPKLIRRAGQILKEKLQQ